MVHHRGRGRDRGCDRLALAVAPVDRDVHGAVEGQVDLVVVGAAAVFLRFDLEHHLGRVVIGFLIDQDGFDHRLSRHQLDVGAAGLGFRVGRDVKGQGFGPNLPPPRFCQRNPCFRGFGNRYRVIQIGLHLDRYGASCGRRLLRGGRDVQHARHECQRAHQRLGVAVADQHDDLAGRAVAGSRHGDRSAFVARAFHFGLPCAVSEGLNVGFGVGSGQREGNFRRFAHADRRRGGVERDAELHVQLERQHRSVGQRQVNQLAVLARGDRLEQILVRLGLSAVGPRRAVVVGYPPMAVFDLEFGGDARYGKFFAVVEDKVAVERPVVDTVGILFHPDDRRSPVFSVADGDRRGLAGRGDQRDDVAAVFTGLYVRDEPFPGDKLLECCDVGVERLDERLQFGELTVEVVQPFLDVRIVVRTSDQCH